jgi:hypothetical protein
MRAERREETAAALSEQLGAAEAEIEVPEGLWERVRARLDDVTVAAAAPPPIRRRMPFAVIAVAATAVVVVICGSWWLVAPSSNSGPARGTSPAGPPGAITLRVHNAEEPCRKLRTLECSLRVAKNPYVLYADPGNAAGRIWHGDRLFATCVVTDGRMITDERGVSSTRWYRVEKAEASGRGGRFEGWLPGVRTRNSTEVPDCSGAERPEKPQHKGS